MKDGVRAHAFLFYSSLSAGVASGRALTTSSRVVVMSAMFCLSRKEDFKQDIESEQEHRGETCPKSKTEGYYVRFILVQPAWGDTELIQNVQLHQSVSTVTHVIIRFGLAFNIIHTHTHIHTYSHTRMLRHKLTL